MPSSIASSATLLPDGQTEESIQNSLYNMLESLELAPNYRRSVAKIIKDDIRSAGITEGRGSGTLENLTHYRRTPQGNHIIELSSPELKYSFKFGTDGFRCKLNDVVAQESRANATSSGSQTNQTSSMPFTRTVKTRNGRTFHVKANAFTEIRGQLVPFDGVVAVFGSNRTLEGDEADAFIKSLQF